MGGAAPIQRMALEITTCVKWESDVVCYKKGHKFFTKEVFLRKKQLNQFLLGAS